MPTGPSSRWPVLLLDAPLPDLVLPSSFLAAALLAFCPGIFGALVMHRCFPCCPHILAFAGLRTWFFCNMGLHPPSNGRRVAFVRRCATHVFAIRAVEVQLASLLSVLLLFACSFHHLCFSLFGSLLVCASFPGAPAKFFHSSHLLLPLVVCFPLTLIARTVACLFLTPLLVAGDLGMFSLFIAYYNIHVWLFHLIDFPIWQLGCRVDYLSPSCLHTSTLLNFRLATLWSFPS